MGEILDGATKIAGIAGLEVFRLRDGRVALAHARTNVLEASDRLRIDYGGMSAAVGVVPVVGVLIRGEREEHVFYESVDEHMTGADSGELRDALEAVLVVAAQASGAHYVTFAEQHAEILAAERARKERWLGIVDRVAAARAGFVALPWDLGNACVLKDASGVRVIAAAGRTPPQLDETLARMGAAGAARSEPAPVYVLGPLVVRFAMEREPEAAPCDVLFVRYSVSAVPKVPVQPFLLVPSAFDAGFGWMPEYLEGHFRGAAMHVHAPAVGVIEGPELVV